MVKSQNLQESMIKDIQAFHNKFGIPLQETPSFLNRSFMMYRIGFLQEEIEELHIAFFDDDLEKAFDALIDLVYVAIGTAHIMNLPFKEGWTRVHHANMQKVRAEGPSDPRSKRNSTYDIVKPDGWQPPRLKDLLDLK